MALEKTLESPLDWKEIHTVHPKGNQSWLLIGRTDIEAETPIFWPPDAKSWLIWEDPDAGKDWGQEEKGMTEDEMVGWHHQLNGHGFGWTLGVGDGQGGLACCGSWGHKELDMTERLDWTELIVIADTLKYCLCHWSEVKVAQVCPTLCNTVDYSLRDSPGQNTRMGSLSFLQGIFPTWGSNPGLPNCKQILYQLSHKGSPRISEWVAYPISSGSSQPRNQTRVSCTAGEFFTNWATREASVCHYNFEMRVPDLVI